jgi:hypothetical protein
VNGFRPTPRELQEQCLRIVVSVCFLATGADRLIDPEVLSMDLAGYLEACERKPTAAERLIAKARSAAPALTAPAAGPFSQTFVRQVTVNARSCTHWNRPLLSAACDE